MDALPQYHNQLGAKIRKLRTEAGLTLERLAQEVEIDASFLGYLERGERTTTTDKIFKLANALNVEPKELFIWE
jgi:transcriptional regulator with XRE-family HTH domain